MVADYIQDFSFLLRQITAYRENIKLICKLAVNFYRSYSHLVTTTMLDI